MTTLDELHAFAHEKMAHLPAGEPLDALACALVELGVASSVTALDAATIDAAVAGALAAGGSSAQLEETITLVSGLGVHTLMIAAPRIVRAMQGRADTGACAGPLDPERQALWNEKIGDDRFWAAFDAEVPGFLDALLRLSPATFREFFAYCALPWRSATVPAQTKELIAMACDATPTHCFAPGFRFHLGNAIKLGASKRQVLEALSIARGAASREDHHG